MSGYLKKVREYDENGNLVRELVNDAYGVKYKNSNVGETVEKLLEDSSSAIRFIFPKNPDLTTYQGDACVIKTPTKAVMIDAWLSEAWNTVKGMLDRAGVTYIDMFILSHYHADHYGCLGNLIESGYVDADTEIYLPAETAMVRDTTGNIYANMVSVKGILGDAGISYQLPAVGKKVTYDDVTFTFFNCSPSMTYENYNNQSTINLIEYGSQKALFTGDVYGEPFGDLYADGHVTGHINLYKIGHHGINAGSSQSLAMFLDAICPDISVDMTTLAGSAENIYHNGQQLGILQSQGSAILPVHMQDNDYIEVDMSETDTWIVSGRTTEAVSSQRILRHMYVDPSAAGLSQTGTEDHPFASIQQAIGACDFHAAADYTLHVKPGTYGQEHSMPLKNLITLTGARLRVDRWGDSGRIVLYNGLWATGSDIRFQYTDFKATTANAEALVALRGTKASFEGCTFDCGNVAYDADSYLPGGYSDGDKMPALYTYRHGDIFLSETTFANTGEAVRSSESKVTLSASSFIGCDTGINAINMSIIGDHGSTFTNVDIEKQISANSYDLNSLLGPMYGSIVSDVEAISGGLRVTWLNGSYEDFEISGSGDTGGLAFDSGYQDEEGYIHLTSNGEDLDTSLFTPFQVSGGGGGTDTGSRMTVSMITTAMVTIVEETTSCPISASWSSVDSSTGASTGAGTVVVTVGGTQKTALSAAQGTVTIDVRPYLSVGTNTVRFTFTDSYGKSVTRTWTVSMESFSLTWSLDSVQKNTESSLQFYLTPVGSGSKTIYIKVDGVQYSSDVVTTTGRRLTKTITGLSHGAHTVEAYGTMDVNGATIESDHLYSTVAQVSGSTTPIVAVNWPQGELAQYTTFNIEYMVIDPANNPATVSLLIGGVVQQTVTVDQSAQEWAYRPMASGTFTFGILCGTVSQTRSLTIEDIGGGIAEITDGLQIKLDPSTVTDLANWTYGNYSLSLSPGFDLVNGGVQTDAEGVPCIRITAGDRLTLNYAPFFGSDARQSGRELKIIYKIADCSSKTAVGISCLTGGIGFKCEANNVYVSGDQTTLTLPVCEDFKTELDINIQQDSEDSLAYIWESCSTFAYAQYAATESYSQSSSTGITFGSDAADVYIYLFRGYSRDLTDTELKANYIADGKDGPEIVERHNRNDIYDGAGNIDVSQVVSKCPYVDVYVIDADRMTTGKKDYVTGKLRHWQGADSYHAWEADVSMSIQGTSSVEHATTAGGNLNFVLSNITCEDGTSLDGWAFNGTSNSIPTTMINFKKNIASEDHIVNIASAEWYNRYQQSVRSARQSDSRIRDCLEGKMAVVFFHNTGSTATVVGPDTVQPDETVFFGLGNTCSNKDAEEVFAYDPIVIEVKNNTEPQVRFKSADLAGDNFDNNYEFRYLDDTAYTETQAKALWQIVQTFVYETDYTAATNTALSPAVTVNGQIFTVDSAAYRKARWLAEAADHFDMDTLYFHHNLTLLLLLRDNRAKNMFWSYNPTKAKWGLWFNWDNDTGLCRNNEGYVDIEPGWMDFDTIGTSDVFNGADNAVFTSLRENNWSSLQSSYLTMESAGATDIDALYSWMMTRQEYLCESLWIEDAEHNAIRVMQNLGSTAYLGRATGRLRLHLYKALLFQRALVDSYYIATAATSGSAALRGYTPSTWTGVRPSGSLSVTPYTNIYINVLAGSTPYKVRAYEGTAVTIDVSAALNDTEIYLRSAEWIQELGDLSPMYLGQFEAANLKRIRTLLIGSEVSGYQNTNFRSITLTNCKLLKTLCLGGMVNAAQAFDFSSNIYLDYIYTKDSGVTGIVFAKNGKLTEAHLNALSSLTMKGLHFLDVFDMASYASLTSVTIEDSPAADSYAIAAAAAALNRVRLTDIAWTVDVGAYDVLVRLHNIYGIDDDGYSVPNGVITGSCYFRSITQSKYNSIVSLIPEVEFTYGEVLDEVNITFQNDDGTTLYVTKTERGGGVPDPIRAGIIQAPTKEPTITTVFTFYNWDRSLDYFDSDSTVTAIYTESERTYTVRYLDYDGSVMQTNTDVPAYGSTSYTGQDLSRAGYIWVGWDTDTESITKDTDVSAVYVYPSMPAVNRYDDMADYDFAYSDDPGDSSAYTFGEIYSIVKTGRAAAYLPVTSKVKLVWHTDVITDEYTVFNVHSYGHYELADDSGNMSNCDFFMTHTLIATRQMNGSNTNVGGWDGSALRNWLNGTLYKAMPAHWRQLIAQSITLASAGAQSSTIKQSADYLRLMSHTEVGFDVNATPYKDEISSRAAERTFSQYTNNTSRVKKNYYGTGTAQWVWLRSADSGSASAFRIIGTNGSANGNNASNSNGVCFGFSV